MYLLDTNVISELRRSQSRRSHPEVIRWVESVPQSSFYLSAMTIFELELGTLLASRTDPVKAAVLRRWIEDNVLPAFRDRVLPIDIAIAKTCAALHAPRTPSERDAFIAATALVHGLTVVTRNTADFAPTGVPTLNPWDL